MLQLTQQILYTINVIFQDNDGKTIMWCGKVCNVLMYKMPSLCQHVGRWKDTSTKKE